MSPKRQDAGEWATLARSHPAGTILPRHQHRTGQLVFATQGIMLVETLDARWTIPPQRALWLPPQQPHAIHMLTHTEMRTVYCQPALIARSGAFAQAQAVHAVAASPLLRELVLGLFDTRYDLPTRQSMVALMLQALRQTPDLPTQLPMPHSEGLRRALSHLLTTQHWQLPMHRLAEQALMSERSFTRHFTAEVGMSLRAWRQRARLLASIDLLADRRPVKTVASSLQFASTAAYIAAFRALMGCTPKAFQDRLHEPAFK